MSDKLHDADINTDEKIKNDQVRRMPHERDESPDGQDADPRGVMQQAASDLENGLVDTDLHGKPGAAANVDTGAAAAGTGQAKPQQDNADSMRFTTNITKSKGTTP
ncbi:MAG: hypothetical protein ACJ8HI_18880 [Massilia sp.]